MRSIILLLLAAPAAFAAWPNGFTYRRTVSVNASQVLAAQTGFPMLLCFNGAGAPCNNSNLSVPGLKTVANGGSVRNTCSQAAPAMTVGCDVVFTSDAAGSSVLKFEWEKYTPSTGETIVWVNMPALSNGTAIYLFYGNASITTFQGNVAGVWDANYKLVWHLPNGSALSASDSTTNANGLVNNGATAATGQLDGGAAFNGTNQAISSSATVNFSGKVATVSLWINSPSWAGGVLMETSANFNSNAGALVVDPGFEAGGKWGFEISKGDSVNYNGVTLNSNPSTGAWHHLAFTVDLGVGAGQAVVVYIDGVPATVTQNHSSDLSGINLGNFAAFFMARNSSQYFQGGSLDEIRISNSKRSATWIATEYNNQSAPAAFYTVGAEQVPTVTGASYLILGFTARRPLSWRSALLPYPTGRAS